MTSQITAISVAERTADWINPLKTVALFDSFGASLMPRAGLHRGMVAGLSLLAEKSVGREVDAGIRRVVPGSSPLALRLWARASADIQRTKDFDARVAR